MAELTAIGPESYQRWQNTLPEGEVVRLGRAPRHGWKVSWDCHISREHAELTWQNDQLLVECLETARNAVHAAGQKGTRFLLAVGDSFRIGQTQFLITASEEEPESIQEIMLEGDDATYDNPMDAARRLEFVMRLPSIIAKTRTDEELAEQLTKLLLEALPRVNASATIRFESMADVDEGKRSMIRWDCRDGERARFNPSKQLIRAAMHRGKSVLHSFVRGSEEATNYTMTMGLDWAICTPITTKGHDCWCLYVAGSSEGMGEEDVLRSDLRFTTLMAQFIGSIRQVRQLEKIQAGMSQFFSPTVVETLSGKSGSALTAPRVSDVTVLFCDVRGFSQMTESASGDLFPLLSRVSAALGMMTQNIVKHDGVIADFQGDAALGFWGWPLAPDEGALPACRAALGIAAGFDRANESADHELCGFHVGIGLSHGRAIAGRIGSDEQVKVGVFGPRVNLGSRLQGMSKQLGVSILMDEPTSSQARDRLRPEEGRCRKLGTFIPVGIHNPVEASELLPPETDQPALTNEQIQQFEEAVDCFTAGDWGRAQQLFEEIPESDGPRRFYLAFLDKHDATPPPDWKGIITLKDK